MIIATFGQTTAWVGKKITYEDGQFMLEDSGPMSAAQVLACDRTSPLTWSTQGTRAWVCSLAQSGPPAAAPSACRFDRGHYIGGHPSLGPAVDGRLWVTTEYIGMQQPEGGVVASLPMGHVAKVGVHGGQVAGSRVTAAVRIGGVSLGAKDAADAKDRAFILAHDAAGEHTTYAVDRMGPSRVRAALGPILAEAGVPFAEAAPAASEPSTIDEVERLAALHADGSLTDAEFRTRLGPVFTQAGAPAEEAGAAPLPQAAVDAALERLAALRDAGAITDADFAAMKAKLLG